MSSPYVNTPLFGGAITVDLPSDFADVSTIRDVPDHQEVYLSQTGLSSIIFDIVERAAPPTHPCTTDEEALKYHYNDIVAAGYGPEGRSEADEVSKVWSSNSAVVDHLPSTPAYTLLATQYPTSHAVTRRPTADFTAILLTLVRLAEQNTDIIISINVPHVPGEYQPLEVNLEAGKWGPLIEAALAYRMMVLKTFAIVDWGLFGEEYLFVHWKQHKWSATEVEDEDFVLG